MLRQNHSVTTNPPLHQVAGELQKTKKGDIFMNFDAEISLFTAGIILTAACTIVFATSCFIAWMNGKHFAQVAQANANEHQEHK
jgi:hypothetical protein